MVHASERERADVKSKRENWQEQLKTFDPKKLVFLDESGTNIDMARRYGRSKGKARVVDHVPLNTPKTTTLISSIRLNGESVHQEIEGALNGEKFQEYLQKDLKKRLNQGDIVIMDNLRTHKMNWVAELIAEAKATVVYLPPYSPDLNPIEKMWSKIKSCIRKLRPTSVEKLKQAISTAFGCISSADCVGWFASCGIPSI